VRFLVLSPFVPYPPVDGGRLRIYELMRRVAQRHDVDFVALSDGSDDSLDSANELRRIGFDVTTVVHSPPAARAAAQALRRGRSYYGTRYRSEELQGLLASRLAGSAYDVVQAEYSYMGAYRPLDATRWILDEHNVEFRINETLAGAPANAAYRAYARRERRLRRREELRACIRADHVLATSGVDRDALRRELPNLPVTVVPNGVDLDRFSPAARRPSTGPPTAVFIGKMDYRPNVDAVTWFADDVLPRIRRVLPRFSLQVIGGPLAGGVAALGGREGIAILGRVEDTRPYLDSAGMALIPLRAGSGTRLKILEAFAAGVPVASTGIGCEGLAVEHGRELLVADDAAAFAAAAVRLADDPALCSRLTTEARALVEARYGWDALARLVEDVAARVAPRPELEAVVR